MHAVTQHCNNWTPQELRDLNQAERERHQETRRGLQEALTRAAQAEADAASAATAASHATGSAAEREALLRDFAAQVLP